MKRFYLLMFAVFIGMFCLAQKHERVNQQKDTKVIDGFTVQLKDALENTYLFDITKNGKTLLVLAEHPVTMRHIGFNTKVDTYKIAQWLINEYKVTGNFPKVVPPHVPLQLGIRIDNK